MTKKTGADLLVNVCLLKVTDPEKVILLPKIEFDKPFVVYRWRLWRWYYRRIWPMLDRIILCGQPRTEMRWNVRWNKRHWIIISLSGGTQKVRAFVLIVEHNGPVSGVHMEGTVWHSLFGLLCYDIIFDHRIGNVWLSEVQVSRTFLCVFQDVDI